MSRWRQFRALSRFERATFLRALFLLPAVSLGLRLVGFRPVQAALAWLAQAGERPGEQELPALAAGTARMVNAAACHGLLGSKCLSRCLATWFLLQRRGIESNVRIGVRKLGGELKAHSWVECDGAVLADAAEVGTMWRPFATPVNPK